MSFEVGVVQLGGAPLILSASDLQLGRGESVEDTARVLSRYVDVIIIRCFQHETLLTLAEHATVPVINALTQRSHPCQLMADLMTMIEYHGPLAGQSVAWVGDGNNVAVSWIEAAVRFSFHLRIAVPQNYAPPSCAGRATQNPIWAPFHPFWTSMTPKNAEFHEESDGNGPEAQNGQN